jgi:hypothetical protein
MWNERQCMLRVWRCKMGESRVLEGTAMRITAKNESFPGQKATRAPMLVIHICLL